ncbi:MAG: hypothetical protein WBI17_12920 [Clostridiaceae bacterium]
MILFKKSATFFMHYAFAILIANLVVGILSLIFKITLLTVQGPTKFSRLSEIATYYIALSFAFYFLFRSYAKKYTTLKLKEMILAASLILILHAVIVFTAEWNTVWYTTTGSSSLAKELYTGGGYLESMRDIPRFYYFMALFLEDLCFLIFSSIGYNVGIHHQKNRRNDKTYPFNEIIK